MLKKTLNFLVLNRIRLVVFAVLASLLCAIDLGVKFWAESRLVERLPSPSSSNLEGGKQRTKKPFNYRRRDIVVVENYWSFTYVRNHDVGFSALLWMDNFLEPKAKQTLVKALQSLAIVVAMAYFLANRMQYFVPFVLIVGGGLGNVVDRFFRGYVVDYIKWSFPPIPLQILNPWPVFNLSDSFVSVGMVLLLVQVAFRRPKFLRN